MAFQSKTREYFDSETSTEHLLKQLQRTHPFLTPTVTLDPNVVPLSTLRQSWLV